MHYKLFHWTTGSECFIFLFPNITQECFTGCKKPRLIENNPFNAYSGDMYAYSLAPSHCNGVTACAAGAGGASSPASDEGPLGPEPSGCRGTWRICCWDFGNIKEKEKVPHRVWRKGVVVFRLYKNSEALFQFSPVIDTLSLVYLTLFWFLFVGC